MYDSNSFSLLKRGTTRSLVLIAFPTSFAMSVKRGTTPPATYIVILTKCKSSELGVDNHKGLKCQVENITSVIHTSLDASSFSLYDGFDFPYTRRSIHASRDSTESRLLPHSVFMLFVYHYPA